MPNQLTSTASMRAMQAVQLPFRSSLSLPSSALRRTAFTHEDLFTIVEHGKVWQGTLSGMTTLWNKTQLSEFDPQKAVVSS